MRRPVFFVRYIRLTAFKGYSTHASKPPIIQIDNGTFYRNYPSAVERETASNATICPNLNFSLPFSSSKNQHWAIIGSSNAGKTTFLEILRGQHLSLPPTARSFPYLASDETDGSYRNPARAIQYVGFDGERGGIGRSGTRGAYLSARYESRREDTDFSVLDFLKGNTELNPSEEQEGKDVNDKSLDKVIADLKLQNLIHMPMGNLSNGQSRRARIARALLGKPMILLLDEPFMGLDPPTVTTLSPLLYTLAKTESPRLVLALRPQDPIPDWITHVIHLGPPLRILYQGEKANVPTETGNQKILACSKQTNVPEDVQPQTGLPIQHFKPKSRSDLRAKLRLSRDGLPLTDRPGQYSLHKVENILVNMKDVHVKYKDKEVLGDWEPEVKNPEKKASKARTEYRSGLSWQVYRGQRWGVLGPNGSGKTTLLSLICSDHPQVYSQSVEIFGRSRLPSPGQPGISIFDIQANIGQSSPEIHAFFPRRLSIRQTLENAWADTFLGSPKLDVDIDGKVDFCLRWFEAELNPAFDPTTMEFQPRKVKTDIDAPRPRSTDWADDIKFGDVPFSAHRVALFLRAIVKKPDLVILDEAFSGMDDYVRDKCMLFLTWGGQRTFGMVDVDGVQRRIVTKTPQAVEREGERSSCLHGLEDRQALICVSHIREEVPGVVKDWICLPEPGSGKPPRFGRFKKPLEADEKAWKDLWGV